MAQPLDLSRRKALKILAGAPMLPLGSVAASISFLTACGGHDDTPASVTTAQFTKTSFGSMAVPSLTDAAAMAKTSVASTMTLNFSDGSSRAYKLAYQSFFMTGDTVTNTAGGYFDINNQPIVDTTASGGAR